MEIAITTGLTGLSGPFVLGQAGVGATLSLTPVPLDGASPMTYRVQWRRDGAAIAGATRGTFTTESRDIGHDIDAEITLPDGSRVTTPNVVRVLDLTVPPPAPPAVLTAARVTANDLGDGRVRYSFTPPVVGGTAPIAVTPRLRLDGVDVTAALAGLDYTVTKTAQTQALEMVFTATNGTPPAATSTVTATVPADAAPVTVAPSFTALPGIIGTPEVGAVLTLSEGTLAGTAPIDVTATLTLNGTPLTAGQTYTVTAPGTLVWSVTARNAAGSVTESATVTVTAAAPVTSVDLSRGTGSLKFPEGASYAADVPDALKLALSQPTANLQRPFTGFRNDGNTVILHVRLPELVRRGSLQTAGRFAIWGDNNTRIFVDNSAVGFAERSQGDCVVNIPPGWTNFMIFAQTGDIDEVDRRSLTLINVETGAVAQSNYSGQRSGERWTGAPYLGGQNAATVTNGFPGEIAFVAHVMGNLWARQALFNIIYPGARDSGTDITLPSGAVVPGGVVDKHMYFRRIAAGENLQAVIHDVEADRIAIFEPQNGVHPSPFIDFARDFDGTAATLDGSNITALPQPADSFESSPILRDTTQPTQVTAGSALRPGTDIAWRGGNLLVLDSIAAPGTQDPVITPGWVVGLAPGATSAPVAVQGRAFGYTGQVEARFIYASTGDVAMDWTAVGPISNGAWSGTVTVPKSAQGWLVSQFRVAGEVWNHRDPWAVGYRFLLLGQSQMTIMLGGDTNTIRMDPANWATASYAVGPGDLRLLEPRFTPDSMAALVDQFRMFDPATPIMFVQETQNGTGLLDMITTGQGRDWATFQPKIDRFGGDFSAILTNWGTNDSALSGPEREDMWDAAFLGTVASDQSFADAFQAGYVVGISPVSRHTERSGIAGFRSQQVAWAHANNAPTANGVPRAVVGPPVIDFEIEASGGPHQVGNASIVMGARMGILAAQAVGLTVPENPSYSGATLSADRTQIIVSVDLPNGGSLYSPEPTALQSWLVDNGGAGSLTDQGFTAAISGDTVVITKDTGTWASGTVVRYRSDGANRAGGDVSAERAILAGMLYETTPLAWPLQPVQGGAVVQGIPVTGSRDAQGRWATEFQATAF